MTSSRADEARRSLASLLAHRRDYCREVQDVIARAEFVVFYGCGAILASIVESWDQYVGRRIDFTCDSDPAKWGREYCGAKCLSPEELIGIKDRCAVFVTVGQFKPVFDFLVRAGFPSVNLIYKYDLAAGSFLNETNLREVAENLYRARSLLADSRSTAVFDAIVRRVLGPRDLGEQMSAVCEGDQYFPADVIQLAADESFVDVGAYDGDTVLDFIRRVDGKFDKVFAFELSEPNFALLQDNLLNAGSAARIKSFNLGLWDTSCEISYSFGKSQSTIGAGEGSGRVAPLDLVLPDERVTMIKMDIEGAEPNALRGAQKTIHAQRPKLAICVYHDFRHLWEIPLYIKELVPDYRIFLRHHTNLEYETVCYATV